MAGTDAPDRPVLALRPAMPPTEARRLIAVLTLVLWAGCLTVGLVGLRSAYPRPTFPVRPAPAPVVAEVLEVKLIPTLTSAPTPAPAWTPPDLPPPPPTPLSIPEAAPLLAVATPSPAPAFAVPVEGPVQVVPQVEAAQTRPPAARSAPAGPPAAQPLTFGQGEGNQPAPTYPRAAVRSGQEGTVRVGLTVGTDGRVLAAEIVAPAAWPLLNEAALQAVRQRWRFSPGAVRRYEVAIRFEIEK